MERIRLPIKGVRTRVRLDRFVDTDDIDKMEEYAIILAQEDFWSFRCWLDPSMKKGWWQREMAGKLQEFYDDMIAGLAPVMVIGAPPQHGKSRQVVEFIAWILGKNPELASIYASFSEDLGDRANRTLQRILDSERYQRVFPNTKLTPPNLSGSGRAVRQNDFFELVGQKGSFRNTTVLGSITGQGLDLGVVDDPIKGRVEANSETIRNKTWQWLVDDFFTRFSERAAMLMIMTRWHVDDPAGRWIEEFEQTRVLRYAAIATKDGKFRKKGEPLFPEHKSKKFLLRRKRLMTQGSWQSIYQQSPIIVGGGLFPIEKFQIQQAQPHPRDIARSVRYWDKAATEDGGAWSSGVLMHEMRDGRFVISSVVRGQWNARKRNERMKQVAHLDREMFGARVKIWVEQEPGSGGKESAEASIIDLRGFTVAADRVTGDKETRAEPYAAQVQGGNVWLVSAAWNGTFIDEHETFPNGKYKDQVDSAAGAFAKVSNKPGGSYDSTYSWL